MVTGWTAMSQILFRADSFGNSLWGKQLAILVSVLSALKGTVTWDFKNFLWLEWIYLGLNVKRIWFFSYKEIPSILDSQFKYWCVSYQTFSEICRIESWVRSSPIFLFSELAVLREMLQRVLILIGDSLNLRGWLTTNFTVLPGYTSTT
jgi:hypothetical protein